MRSNQQNFEYYYGERMSWDQLKAHVAEASTNYDKLFYKKLTDMLGTTERSALRWQAKARDELKREQSGLQA